MIARAWCWLAELRVPGALWCRVFWHRGVRWYELEGHSGRWYSNECTRCGARVVLP
jgi:hypothetical protein